VNAQRPRLPIGNRTSRFPGYDVMDQREHWDDATRAAITTRLDALPPIRFFTPEEEAAAKALLDRLMGQDESVPGEGNVEVPLVHMVDVRLVEDETDGWHYDTMPPDPEAWRKSLAGLDADARERFGAAFAECSMDDQRALLKEIHTSKAEQWHGMPPERLWSLWTRYAATAFYSHPAAWNEIGYGGPAYPRGYKNLGVDRWEPYEVPDARPSDDPVRGQG